MSKPPHIASAPKLQQAWADYLLLKSGTVSDPPTPLPQNLGLIADITNGRKYQMQLSGRGKRPRLSFSFSSHDFGPCFVVTPRNGMAPQTLELRLANEDEHEVYFDMPFTATPFLSATTSKTVLAPGEVSEVLLTFSPPEVDAYEAVVPFVVNGLWNVDVKVRGEGCELKLELADPQQQQLNLGAVPVYQQVARQVNLINRSRRAVDIDLRDAAAQLAQKSVLLSLGGGSLEGRGCPGAAGLRGPAAAAREPAARGALRAVGAHPPLLGAGGAHGVQPAAADARAVGRVRGHGPAARDGPDRLRAGHPGRRGDAPDHAAEPGRHRVDLPH